MSDKEPLALKNTSVIVMLALAALAFTLISGARVTADAYITFRVVDNVVHGYGLRWNTAERVQVYTHPLWMLFHVPFYALGINIFYVSVAISPLCTLVALLLTVHTFRKDWPQTMAMLLMPLIASQSFM